MRRSPTSPKRRASGSRERSIPPDNRLPLQVLKALPLPLTVTEAQFLVGSMITLLAWSSGVLKPPQLTLGTVRTAHCAQLVCARAQA